ncbi:MAG: DMT family transporter [Woeseiaceae bacterium]|nr:DMT family transporter [Woeseiaceae bacterium]
MRDVFLFATLVLIWGSTFAAIPFQLGVVAVEWSVAYRFGIATLALALYAVLSKRSLALPDASLPFVFLQGILLFSLNYFLVYYASAYITTGLIAVLFSLIILSNAGFERLFFKTRIDARFVVAAALGVTGIACVFWPEVRELSFEDTAVLGIALTMGSVLSASLGNMTATRNTRRQLPVVALNAYAMGFATLFSSVVALILERPIAFSLDLGYVLSLAYLSVFGSAVAFGCYLALIRSIGPSRAAYSSVLFPIVALALSTLIEDYEWTTIAALGVMLALLGNWILLSKPKTNKEDGQ